MSSIYLTDEQEVPRYLLYYFARVFTIETELREPINFVIDLGNGTGQSYSVVPQVYVSSGEVVCYQ